MSKLKALTRKQTRAVDQYIINKIGFPSGLDCDTGEPFWTSIKANVTCTLISIKTGFLNKEAEKYLGKIEVINLGVPNQIIESVLM